MAEFKKNILAPKKTIYPPRTANGKPLKHLGWNRIKPTFNNIFTYFPHPYKIYISIKLFLRINQNAPKCTINLKIFWGDKRHQTTPKGLCSYGAHGVHTPCTRCYLGQSLSDKVQNFPDILSSLLIFKFYWLLEVWFEKVMSDCLFSMF